MQETRFNPSTGEIPWSSKWQPAPVFLPGTKLHGQRNLVGHNPQSCKQWDTSERTHTVCTFSSFQSLSHVPVSATPWTAARQASLSITNSQSLLKLMSIKSRCHPTISSSVIPFSRLQSFPASGSFPVSQFFTSGGQSIGASASESV